ncbi:hypothetical protein HETIRDRAFT_455747 [Heterobasidion irregulare TC 32-1]|uniref:Uncharacterized protein n=1 Tax=Heterobasidion irregulare (strain TC 32-1) TaxID=747525 RepID=W4JRM1_HETIT|nr:uncharacterized protein HETIRDRAFT_455747 [Heterobasidion irregulare TC 32-1]ETW76222.1 hypothetical protein HETIRDRAFT_455747 [Heterobasidion irregulare TC 32-1]
MQIAPGHIVRDFSTASAYQPDPDDISVSLATCAPLPALSEPLPTSASCPPPATTEHRELLRRAVPVLQRRCARRQLGSRGAVPARTDAHPIPHLQVAAGFKSRGSGRARLQPGRASVRVERSSLADAREQLLWDAGRPRARAHDELRFVLHLGMPLSASTMPPRPSFPEPEQRAIACCVRRALERVESPCATAASTRRTGVVDAVVARGAGTLASGSPWPEALRDGHCLGAVDERSLSSTRRRRPARKVPVWQQRGALFDARLRGFRA